jgi:alpha/beta superfamily hydrolase
LGIIERPVYLASEPSHLFAILAEPAGAKSDLGVVMLHARNRTNTANRNRSGVWLSRAFAARGVRSIRFDFHGCGDSTGEGVTGLTRQAGMDVLTAARQLVDAGCSRIVLTGNCYGAMAGLMVANEIPQLVAISMMNPPFASLKFPGQTKKLDHSRWITVIRTALHTRVFRLLATSPEYRKFIVVRARRRYSNARLRRKAPGTAPAPAVLPPPGQFGSTAVAARMSGAEWAVWKLQPLVDRGVQVRMFVDQHEKLYRDFEELKKKELGDLIANSGGLVRTVTAPNTRHGMQISLEGQAFVASEIVAWVEELATA